MSANLTPSKALALNFMGTAPVWYKLFIVACLIINPILYQISPFTCGWVLVGEFIFTLAMALECYPLQPGGLLAIEACFMGMCTMDGVKHEIFNNLEVLLLLMFMLGGIHFVRDFLLFIFSKILVKVRNHVMIAFLFCFVGGFLAAFVDALTVLAVIIAVCMGLYRVYHSFICGDAATSRLSDDHFVPDEYKQDLEKFRAFLRSILMHAAVCSRGRSSGRPPGPSARPFCSGRRWSRPPPHRSCRFQWRSTSGPYPQRPRPGNSDRRTSQRGHTSCCPPG